MRAEQGVVARLKEETGLSLRAFCGVNGLNYIKTRDMLSRAEKMTFAIAVALKAHDLNYILTGERRGSSARSSHAQPPHRTLIVPSEDVMQQLGETWTKLVEVVKRRETTAKREWRIIIAALEDYQLPMAKTVTRATAKRRAVKKPVGETTGGEDG